MVHNQGDPFIGLVKERHLEGYSFLCSAGISCNFIYIEAYGQVATVLEHYGDGEEPGCDWGLVPKVFPVYVGIVIVGPETDNDVGHLCLGVLHSQRVNVLRKDEEISINE